MDRSHGSPNPRNASCSTGTKCSRKAQDALQHTAPGRSDPTVPLISTIGNPWRRSYSQIPSSPSTHKRLEMPLLPIQLSNLLSQVSTSGAALAFFNRCTLWKACIEPRNPILGHPNTQNWTVLIVFSFILSCFSWKQTKFQYHYFFICLPAQWRLELKAYLRNKYLRTQAKQWGGTCLYLQSMAREPVWPHKKQSQVFSPRKIPLAQESPKASGHQLSSLKLQSKKNHPLSSDLWSW